MFLKNFRESSFDFRVWMAWSEHGFRPIRARITYMLFYNIMYNTDATVVNCLRNFWNSSILYIHRESNFQNVT